MTIARILSGKLRLALSIGAVGLILAACQHYNHGPGSQHRGPAYRDGHVQSSPNRSNRRRTNQNRTNQRRTTRNRTTQNRTNRNRTTQRQRDTRGTQARPVHSKARTRSYREYQDKN